MGDVAVEDDSWNDDEVVDNEGARIDNRSKSRIDVRASGKGREVRASQSRFDPSCAARPLHSIGVSTTAIRSDDDVDTRGTVAVVGDGGDGDDAVVVAAVAAAAGGGRRRAWKRILDRR